MSRSDLVRKEVNRNIDEMIENMKITKELYGTPSAKSKYQYKDRSDFILGYAYGLIAERSSWYLVTKINQSNVEIPEEELEKIKNQAVQDMNSLIGDRLPEIRRAILRE